MSINLWLQFKLSGNIELVQQFIKQFCRCVFCFGGKSLVNIELWVLTWVQVVYLCSKENGMQFSVGPQRRKKNKMCGCPEYAEFRWSANCKNRFLNKNVGPLLILLLLLLQCCHEVYASPV